MKPCRLHLSSRREIALIWSKIHLFIHDSPLFSCSQDAGDRYISAKTSTGACRAGSTHALLTGGQAKSLRQGVTTGQGLAYLGHRYLGRRYLGQERSGTGREQGLGSHMRLSQENGRELLLRSLSSPQLEGNGYCLKVLNITLNQQLAGAVTSPGSAAHLI